MTVSSLINRVQFQGNGSTTSFAFPYPFFLNSDLNVILFDTIANAVVATVLNGAGTYDFTVTGIVDPATGEVLAGGNVVFNNPPLGNHQVTINRAVGQVQNLSLTSLGTLPAAGLMAALDKLALSQQNLADAATRAVQAPLTDNPAAHSMVLPPVALRNGAVMGFDVQGYPSVGPPGSLAQLIALLNVPPGSPLGTVTVVDPGFYHPGNEVAVLQSGNTPWLLSRNMAASADFYGFSSTDPTTVPITVTVGGTMTAGDIVGFDYNDDIGHTAHIRATVVGGDTATTVAAKLATAFKADATIAQIFNRIGGDGFTVFGIIANAFSSGAVFFFNQAYPWARGDYLNIVPFASPGGGGHASVTIGNLGTTPLNLEVNPVLAMKRTAPGRTPLTGDLIGQLLMVGKDQAGTDQQYGSIVTRIADPTAATPTGSIRISSNAGPSSAGGLNIGKGTWDPSVGDIGADPGFGVWQTSTIIAGLVLAGVAPTPGGATGATLTELNDGSHRVQLLNRANAEIQIGSNNVPHLRLNGNTAMGFFNTAPALKQIVTGARGGNAALASLMAALAAYGFVTDSTS
jgi:hypothetical protein